jgi:hypothetical protein
MESNGAEGDAFRTLYPLAKSTDSITQHPRLCCSPSGEHNKLV